MTPSPATARGSLDGDVLDFARWYNTIAVLSIPAAFILGASGVSCIAYGPWPGSSWLNNVLGGLALLEGTALLGASYYILTHKPRLVLGTDRVQWWVGKRLTWDVSYAGLERIDFFVPVHPWFGYRTPWVRVLGFRLRAPERFDEAHPRLARLRTCLRRQTGFDLAIPTMFAAEPGERCLEALLRCFHRFQTEDGAASSGGSADHRPDPS
jgi:hypothetical protein